MTKREIDKGLGPDDFIVFANTGKEREETLEFLHQQETHWGVRIWWIERDPICRWREVSYETASRNGEPFETLIIERKFLPNSVARFCTQELKIRVMRDFMRSMGFNYWTNYIGIRYDEPHRLANSKDNHDRWDNAYPLYRDKITKLDVNYYWSQQSFNLKLQAHEGNCDLCHLKGKKKKIDIIRRFPERPEWWLLAEKFMQSRFRSTYTMLDLVEGAKQSAMFSQYDLEDDEPTIGCFCTDE